MKKAVFATIFVVLFGSASGCTAFKGFGFGRSEPEFREVTLYEDGFRKEAAPESLEVVRSESPSKKPKSWFTSGDSTFMMSSRAKEISGHMER